MCVMVESVLGDNPFARKIQTLNEKQPRMTTSASKVVSTDEHLEVLLQQESMQSSDLLQVVVHCFRAAALDGSKQEDNEKVSGSPASYWCSHTVCPSVSYLPLEALGCLKIHETQAANIYSALHLSVELCVQRSACACMCTYAGM